MGVVWGGLGRFLEGFGSENSASYTLKCLKHIFSNFPYFSLFGPSGGGPNRENRQGKDLGGGTGYLEGMFGHPSLVTIPRKPKKNQGKPKKKIRICFL